MVQKQKTWREGRKLGEHSYCKHKILGEYLVDYVKIRCQLPQQEWFRLAIIDGFSGGGLYEGGKLGSPLILMNKLKDAVEAVNQERLNKNFKIVKVDCLFIFNDLSKDAIKALMERVNNIEKEIIINCKNIILNIYYLNGEFENVYPKIKEELYKKNIRNVIFNLDQYGHSKVRYDTISDIIRSFTSPEIFYTFAIESLLTFLNKQDPEKLKKQLSPLGVIPDNFDALNEDKFLSRREWLFSAQNIVYKSLSSCATYTSPFAIHNPNGWKYWLIHFAKVPRARQAYNNILHANATLQVHYNSKSGSEFLAHNFQVEEPYLFDQDARRSSREELHNDIPRFLDECGRGREILVEEFYKNFYKCTAAHSDDIKNAMVNNDDLRVITSSGGSRRSYRSIALNDIIVLNPQRIFYFK